MSATLTATRISVRAGCDFASCALIAMPLHKQLSRGYDECAVQPIPAEIDEWRAEHRTARKRADRAYRRGYTFKPIHRHRRVDEIHHINLSAPERQGRPMTQGYRERPMYSPLPDYPCAIHAVRVYGIEDRNGKLVAYTVIHRAGELALVSQILGHAAFLADEVMYLLVQGVLEREREADPNGFLVYNRWDSGTDGLRFFKERLGFGKVLVEWCP